MPISETRFCSLPDCGAYIKIQTMILDAALIEATKKGPPMPSKQPSPTPPMDMTITKLVTHVQDTMTGICT
jgi:hypothetical protein